MIFLSFAKIKQNDYINAVSAIKRIICSEVQKYMFLKDWEGLTEEEKKNLGDITANMDDVAAQEAVADLSNYLSRYYGNAELIKRGVKKENIRHYGFAFRGKEVLISD